MTIIALGTSLGNKKKNLSEAASFLRSLAADNSLKQSSIWETDPVGPSEKTFFNAVIAMECDLPPNELLLALKAYETESGRDQSAPRWSDRIIDLDIIARGNNLFIGPELEIPHPLYTKRRFVLCPLQEIMPGWTDPLTGAHIDDLILKADPLRLSKTSLKW